MSVPAFPHEVIKKLSDELQGAATHAELTEIFKSCRLEPDEGSKPRRIFSALMSEQRAADHIIAFLKALLNPVRFVGNREAFENYRNTTNTILAFQGLQFTEAGQVVQVTKANTINEAEERAGRLKAELTRRRVHSDVLKFCRAELMDQNYFHAILEAEKSVAEKIRSRTGLTEDGSALIDRAFSTSHPFLV